MKTLYTSITPIPSTVPRQLAIELLQSHSEVITVNPLVLNHKPIKAPRDAPSDEYYSTWYEIQERIQYVPGAGRLGSGKLTFKGCFHDMPWGVQTHMYVPMGVDLRHKYQIRGSQPGEPAEPRELGSDAPVEGLYLKEDVQITCNFTVLSFVKKELKAASKVMLERMIKKAELLDAGVLHAMFEDGKIKTVNPNDRSSVYQAGSPYSSYSSNADPRLRSPSFPPHQTSSTIRPSSLSQPPPGILNPDGSGLAIEMPGDTSFYHDSKHLQPPSRFSTHSELSSNSANTNEPGRWSWVPSDNVSSQASDTSRPSSYADGSARSPGAENHYTTELPNNERRHTSQSSSSPGPGHSPIPNANTSQQPIANSAAPLPSKSPQPNHYRYNPQDYANPRFNGAR